MRLVEGAQGSGELPAAQTCAWSDDEEDLDAGDKVAFKSKGDQIFGSKLGSSNKVRCYVHVPACFIFCIG